MAVNCGIVAVLSQNEFCSMKTKPEGAYELVSCEAIRTLDCTTVGDLYLWGRGNSIKSPFAFANRVSERPQKREYLFFWKDSWLTGTSAFREELKCWAKHTTEDDLRDLR